MKGIDIADALSVNPLAEFAVRPGLHDVKVVRVRGLTRKSPGAWRYAEATTDGKQWLAPDTAQRQGLTPATLLTRNLCTVEDAERAVKERIEKNAAQFAANAKLDRIVSALQGHGVEARRALGGVLVRDTVALGRLLARLP